jgi:hypothetical protein
VIKMIEPVLDPRGIQERPKVQLAHRHTLERLRQGPVLFYDNTKLSFRNCSEIFVRIKENFTRDGIVNFLDFRETVRGKTNQELKDYAAILAKKKPVAAVLALGDVGVSPATTIITIALEELGVPSVYITAPPGTALARAVAFYRAGQLCLCPIDIYQGSTVEDIHREIDGQMQCILDSLTLPPDKIGERASLDFQLDAEAPARDGFLKFEDSFKLDEGGLSEPVAGMEKLMALFDSLHLGDGLPIVAPTQRRYEHMLSFCPYKPGEILAAEIGPSGKNITVRDVAIAAIMAGCKPEYMPILLTVFRAMANPKYNFLQSVTTSHPGGNLALVSGPLAQELGIHGGQGCLGPGFTSNMTIGRAVNLAIINICRAVPGYTDLACLSSPAELSYCFAEDPALSPWPTVNAERYNSQTTTVFVLKAEPPHDIIDFLSHTASDLLDTIVGSCTTLGSNNSFIPGNMVVVLTPDHAWLLNREGWNKDRIRAHIHARANHEASMVRDRGIVPVRPEGFNELHPIPVTRSPKDIDVVVAGGRGGHAAVILPWALYSEAIVEPVLLPNGKVPKSISEFQGK